MELTNQLPVSSESYLQTAYTPSAVSASQTQLAAISTSRSLDLNLVTEEGDKVTLSMDAQASAIYFDSTSVSMADNGDYRYSRSELAAGSSQYNLSLTIEGDLSEEEQREIRKVIKTLSKMMDRLAAGNVQPDVAVANKLSGLDTIAGLDAHLSYERQVVVARQTETTAVYDRTGELTNTDAETKGREFSSLPEKAKADEMANEMARHLRKAGAPWVHKMKAVERLFEARRKSAATEANENNSMNIFDYLRERLHDALGQNAGD